MTKREADESAVPSSADGKEGIVDSSSTPTENQSKASSNPAAVVAQEAFRFRSPRSGDPDSGLRKLISERHMEISETRLPEEVRVQLEGRLKMKFPEETTFGDALCVVTWMAALGCIKLGPALPAIKEIRETIKGKTPQGNWIPGPPVWQDGDAIRKHIYGKLIETAYKRRKLYNMPMDGLKEIADEAGVDLDEAMGEKKPSPSGAATSNEELRKSAETHIDSPPKPL
jgi:hypothetical protein